MFATIAVPFDAYRDLPTPQARWLMQCLARYADRSGKAWPNMRQLADDARMSLSTVCRRLKELAESGVFHRERKGVGRYVYTLAEPYRLRWPTRDAGRGKTGVSGAEPGVSHCETQEAKLAKQIERSLARFAGKEGLPRQTEWAPRLRGWLKSGFWLQAWGAKPNEPGCIVPLAELEAIRPGRQVAFE
jgi:DNA-binding transcriptional MocR family regulator